MSEKRFNKEMSQEYQRVYDTHPFLFSLQEKLGKFISSIPGKDLRILEIGSGDGVTTEIILNNRNENLIAIDNEPEMVKMLNQRLSSTRLKVECADAFDYLELNNQYDLIVSGMTLHNIKTEERNILYKKIYNSLKKNGYFVEVDKIYPEWQAGFDILKNRISSYIDYFQNNNQLSLLKDWVLHELEDANPVRIQYETELVEYLAKIGFQEISVSNHAELEAFLVARKYK